jgi:hypothetical protein
LSSLIISGSTARVSINKVESIRQFTKFQKALIAFVVCEIPSHRPGDDKQQLKKNGLGRGAEFFLSLPLLAAHVPRSLPADAAAQLQ